MAEKNDELRRMAHHVAHDVRMLKQAFEQQQHDSFAYTAWFVHCRTVMEFLGEERLDSRDVHASDYVGAKDWTEIRKDAKEPDNFSVVRDAVNALAAHLSCERLKYETGGEYEAYGRPSEEITNYLLALTHLFLDYLPPERRVWFG